MNVVMLQRVKSEHCIDNILSTKSLLNIKNLQYRKCLLNHPWLNIPFFNSYHNNDNVNTILHKTDGSLCKNMTPMKLSSCRAYTNLYKKLIQFFSYFHVVNMVYMLLLLFFFIHQSSLQLIENVACMATFENKNPTNCWIKKICTNMLMKHAHIATTTVEINQNNRMIYFEQPALQLIPSHFSCLVIMRHSSSSHLGEVTSNEKRHFPQ